METSDIVNGCIAYCSRVPGLLEEIETVIGEMRKIVQREDFPSKAQIEEKVLSSENSYTILFNYAMMLNLWNAFKKPTMVGVFVAIREVGQMSTSWKERKYNVSLLDWITHLEDFPDIKCAGPSFRYCIGIIHCLWGAPAKSLHIRYLTSYCCKGG